MYFLSKKKRNEIRDSDEKSAGCGILLKKERECGIRTPPPFQTLEQLARFSCDVVSFESCVASFLGKLLFKLKL